MCAADSCVQATLLNTLAGSDAAVVFSERARLELDTAVGYLPAAGNLLQASSIYAVTHGANVAPVFNNKTESKVLLGVQGKVASAALAPHFWLPGARQGTLLACVVLWVLHAWNERDNSVALSLCACCPCPRSPEAWP